MTSEIRFSNANSRDTYFTVHNIRSAHQLSKGNGIKVGIIDWLFDLNNNAELYEGYANISGESQCLFAEDGHGLMMATTLKEIAPQCKIYAINSTFYNENGEVNRIGYLEESVNWAINNKIDILTYSNADFKDEERIRANKAVEKAVKNGIITTFIHNDCTYNIWPYACFRFSNDQCFSRMPDVNIYHYDYNTLFLSIYERYVGMIKSGQKIQSGNDLPYFSFSSMSVVLAGFIAILKSINASLSPDEYKKLLIETSYEINQKGENWYDLNPCSRVVDIGKASHHLSKITTKIG